MPQRDPVIRQSGVVPFRVDNGTITVLLVTNSGGSRWLVPKGHVEPGLTARQSAVKEAYEEAGIIGVPAHLPVGTFEHVKRGRRCVVDLYAMEVVSVLESWPEQNRRKRRWVALDRAILLVGNDGLAACLRRLHRYVELERAATAA